MLSNLVFIIAATVLGLPPNLADYPKGLETAQQMVKQGENADKGVALFEEAFDYRYGMKQPRNLEKAKELFIAASEAGNADAKLFLADFAINNGDNALAIELANEAIALGNEKAKLIFIEAEEEESEQAKKYAREGFNAMKAAVENGNTHYINWLGYLYDEGIGTPQNFGEALKYFKLGAESGNVVSMKNLALMYRNQEHTKQAMALFQQAAEKNEEEAQFYLAQMFYDEGNTEKALYWFERSAANNDIDAIEFLGDFYSESDLRKAEIYYQKGVALNSAYAMLQLADFYAFGIGDIKKDEVKAVELLQKAAYLNSSAAMMRLASSYEEGKGVQKDFDQAAYWYTLAYNTEKDQNDEDPAELYLILAMMYEEKAQDLSKALDNYKMVNLLRDKKDKIILKKIKELEKKLKNK